MTPAWHRGRLVPHVERGLRDSPHRIVISGAGGWLGLATLEMLHAALGRDLHKRVHCFGSSHRQLRLIDGTPIEQQPLSGLAGLGRQPTLFLHLAFLTKDKAEAMDEAAYVAANDGIRSIVLDSLEAIGADAMFLASSGAAARAADPTASRAMRLYGRLKREDEDAFAHWAAVHNRRAIIARIFNLSGPHINKLDSYALGSFIRDAIAGGPIAIRASHHVVRSYVAIRELMSLVFAALLDDTVELTRFDTGGEPMELQDVAEAVARQFDGVSIKRGAFAAGQDQYTGDAAAYRALLRRHGVSRLSFAEQVAETADFIANFSGAGIANGVAIEQLSC